MSRASVRLGASAMVLAPLTGCATFATNVKGSFSCSAPDGVCAPSSIIDDRALALISGEAAPRPVGVPAAEPAILRTPALGRGQVVHSGQRMLRIVFPAHVDAHGRYHEPSVVRAVVDPGTWLAPAAPAAPDPGALPTPAGAEDGPAATGETTTAATPSPDAVRAARARQGRQPVTREEIAEAARAAVSAPHTGPTPVHQPAPFQARVED